MVVHTCIPSTGLSETGRPFEPRVKIGAEIKALFVDLREWRHHESETRKCLLGRNVQERRSFFTASMGVIPDYSLYSCLALLDLN